MQTEYDFSNAQRATQISHLNRLREQQPLLEEDVSNWLVSCVYLGVSGNPN